VGGGGGGARGSLVLPPERVGVHSIPSLHLQQSTSLYTGSVTGVGGGGGGHTPPYHQGKTTARFPHRNSLTLWKKRSGGGGGRLSRISTGNNDLGATDPLITPGGERGGEGGYYD
ncbi:hypothetical protein CSUI_011588, partial [Cystoisospora suis]